MYIAKPISVLFILTWETYTGMKQCNYSSVTFIFIQLRINMAAPTFRCTDCVAAKNDLTPSMFTNFLNVKLSSLSELVLAPLSHSMTDCSFINSSWIPLTDIYWTSMKLHDSMVHCLAWPVVKRFSVRLSPSLFWLLRDRSQFLVQKPICADPRCVACLPLNA
jgi:hypothetical protein